MHRSDPVNRELVASTMQSTVGTARVSALFTTTTATAITTGANVMARTKHDENPLVFNVPEVPTEVRGVFHKSTGVVNYTALIEFVKNISSATDDNWRKN